jgi:hypothetical protein
LSDFRTRSAGAARGNRAEHRSIERRFIASAGLTPLYIRIARIDDVARMLRE